MALHFTGQVSTGFDPIEPNDYETTISLEYKKTQGGDLFINCKFAIRDDVEQDFQRRIVFDGIYKSKTTGEFSPQKINALLAAINANETTPKWDFEDYDELIQFVNGKNVKITVELVKGDPAQGTNDKNAVKYLSYQPTAFKESVVVEPITKNSEPVFTTSVTNDGYSFDLKKPEVSQPVEAIQKDDILDDLPF